MNYCSRCGSDRLEWIVPDGDHRSRYVCANCQTVHYQNPLTIVGCVVEYEGKILLAKRGIEPRKGYWNLPCGFLENDETADEGALREVFEETGVRAEISRLHSVYSVVHAHQVYLIYRATAEDSHFVLTPESVEIEWFDKDRIPWSDLAFNSNEHALKTYIGSPDDSIVHLGSYLKK